MRSVDENGFGPKVRDWNAYQACFEQWREAWGRARQPAPGRVGHRRAGRSPQSRSAGHRPRTAAQDRAGCREPDGRARASSSERLDEHRDIAREQWREAAHAILRLALDAITHGNKRPSPTRDLAMFVHRHSDGKEQFDQRNGGGQSRAGVDRARQGWTRQRPLHIARRCWRPNGRLERATERT